MEAGDGERSGSSIDATTLEKIEKIQRLMSANRRLKLHDIVEAMSLP